MFFSSLIFNPFTSFAKPIPNGFYIVMNTVRRCPNRVKSLDGSRQFCLPKEPVISEREIESVGELQTHPTLGFYYILIRLNAEGFNALRMVMDKLPGAQVTLVVNGKVAGTFEGLDKSIGRTITILGGQNNIEIDWIYQHLKKNR